MSIQCIPLNFQCSTFHLIWHLLNLIYFSDNKLKHKSISYILHYYLSNLDHFRFKMNISSIGFQKYIV